MVLIRDDYFFWGGGGITKVAEQGQNRSKTAPFKGGVDGFI
jgi:hypothetical protein